jgi:hypothetical protein
MKPNTLLEDLARLEHHQWMTWAKALMDSEPGLSAERRARWAKLMVPYERLTEEQKEQDREWARTALKHVRMALRDVVQE